MMHRITFLCLVIFAVSGCSLYRIKSEETTTQYYPRKAPDQVVYVETMNRPCEVLGFVTVNTERRQTSEDVLERMKKEAAEMGGDAITNLQVNSSSGWQKIPPKRFLKNAYIRANFSATVVAFK